MMSSILMTDDNVDSIPLDPAYTYASKTGQSPDSYLFHQLQTHLGTYITDGFSKAKQHRQQQGIDDRLMNCLRAYKGDYDARTLALLEKMGGTQIFRRVTTEKCEDLGSWLKDVLAPTEDRPFDIKPTPISSLPEEVTENIIQQVVAAAEQEFLYLQQSGVMLSPEQVRDWAYNAAEQMATETRRQIEEEAKTRAGNMMREISDQLRDGDWHKAFREFINDFKMYPNGFIKGPYVESRQQLKWENNQAIVGYEPVLVYKRVSPTNIFPSPNATTIQDGELYERDYFSRKQMQSFLNQPGFNTQAINAVLSNGTNHRLPYVESDTERADLLNLAYAHESNRDDKYEGVWFSGDVRGSWLAEIGLQVDDPALDYPVYALWVAGHVIKALVNPDPLGHRPYSTCSFRSVPGSFWGQSLPESMEDIQKSANAAVRSAVNNMAMSSGPIQSVDMHALAEGQTPQNLSPWMVHEYDGSKLVGAGRKALEFVEIPSHVRDYLDAYDRFKKEADDVTGIPAFVRGNSSTEGAGETARGLAMLMDSAAKGIREIVGNIGNDVICDRIADQYVWNMLYNPDESIKGDCQIVAHGPLAVIAKHQSQIAAGNFLQETNNPTDMSIIGIEGRANVLRHRAKLLDIPDEDIVPSKEDIEQRLKEAQFMPQEQPVETQPEGGAQ